MSHLEEDIVAARKVNEQVLGQAKGFEKLDDIVERKKVTEVPAWLGMHLENNTTIDCHSKAGSA